MILDEKRTTLVVSILASFVSFLDASIVTVALPAMTKSLNGGLFLQQWVADAYLIALGSLILISGSLADVFGQKRIMRIGLYGFAVTSLLCAVSPSSIFLIVSRALQGVAGALLVPSSLALIIASFPHDEQGKAIGSWTAWTGISFIIGPLLGGVLVDAASWRLIFGINIVPIAACLILLSRITREDRTDTARRIDYLGALLCSLGLAGVVFSLIEEPHFGWQHPLIATGLILCALALIAFFVYERRAKDPMLPLSLFRTRNFSAGNIATFAIYAGLSLSTFVISIFLQQSAGYSALEAGLALVPVTVVLFLLSSRFGALSARFGPRLFMTAGPFIGAIGFLLMLGFAAHQAYWLWLFPGILIFGLGLSITVAPLTAAILGAVDPARAGIASAVNNAVARIAGLLAIACIGVTVGPDLNASAFNTALLIIAGLLAAGGVISFLGIRNQPRAA